MKRPLFSVACALLLSCSGDKAGSKPERLDASLPQQDAGPDLATADEQDEGSQGLDQGGLTDGQADLQHDMQQGCSAGQSMTQVAVRSFFLCALDCFGQVWCAPLQASGGEFDNPVAEGIVQIATGRSGGGDTVLMLSKQGGIEGLTQQFSAAGPTIERWRLDLDEVTQIAYGDAHACALRQDATVWCWGRNDFGQFGISLESLSGSEVPVRVPLEGVLQIAAGGHSTCALATGKEVLCAGTLVESRPDTPGFKPVGLDGATKLVMGGSEPFSIACALGGPQSLRCLDKGGKTIDLPKVQAVDVAMTDDVVCILDDQGLVTCIGELYDAQQQPYNPQPTGLPSGADTIARGAERWCVVAEGEVWCWGVEEKTFAPEARRITF